MGTPEGCSAWVFIFPWFNPCWWHFGDSEKHYCYQRSGVAEGIIKIKEEEGKHSLLAILTAVK